MSNTAVFIIVAFVGLLILILFLSFRAKGNHSAETDAKGFAKLLVSEIKLYNDYKLRRGLENNNLYASLQDEIEEARNLYRKRFESPAYDGYFDEALVNVLADGDRNKLGREFNQTLK